MEYEVKEDRVFKGEWHVEAIDYDNDCVVYVTIFYGKDAEYRAREYATWKMCSQLPT